MTIQTAITKAVEAGWKNKEIYTCDHDGIELLNQGAFLDPLFWQALGKSIGWGDEFPKHQWPSLVDAVCVTEGDCDGGCDAVYMGKPWLFHWHRLIDHLAEGKTIESYFEKL